MWKNRVSVCIFRESKGIHTLVPTWMHHHFLLLPHIWYIMLCRVCGTMCQKYVKKRKKQKIGTSPLCWPLLCEILHLYDAFVRYWINWSKLNRKSSCLMRMTDLGFITSLPIGSHCAWDRLCMQMCWISLTLWLSAQTGLWLSSTSAQTTKRYW